MWQSGRTIFELGELAVQRGKTDLANELFNNAMKKFKDLGADIERTRAVLK